MQESLTRVAPLATLVLLGAGLTLSERSGWSRDPGRARFVQAFTHGTATPGAPGGADFTDRHIFAKSVSSDLRSPPEEDRTMMDAYRQLDPTWQLPLITLLALAAGLVLGKSFDALVTWWQGDDDEEPTSVLLIHHCAAPVSLLLPLAMLYFLLPWQVLEAAETSGRTLMKVGIILTSTWLAARVLLALDAVMTRRLGIDQADNLRARSVQTQLRVLRRVAIVVVFTLGVIGMLLSIEGFREFGAGLLASAGIASVVIGLAAQRTLANLLAGFQIGLTQPIRLDDVLVVEGEWGRVEEITLTYVVVAIWDQRRLILPISYFLEKPFQNWTRTTAEILGTVFIHADYTLDVPALREAVERFAGESAYYDGRVCRLHVTGSGERSMELRALVSARSSGDAWELRCELREKLVRYLQQEHPEALPVLRAVPPAAAGAAE